MSNTSAVDWKEARRRLAREAIVDAAWELVRAEGLGALSLRELASRAGITTPTVYAYFGSKNGIYDAMFARAASEFAHRMAEPYGTENPRAVLTEGLHRFVDFCITDVARHQLLFHRPVPGFEPSRESFEPAVRALDVVRKQLAANGITDGRHVDMWTALTTGLVDQQIANDPGGDRWVRLVDDVVSMYLAHCRPARRFAPEWPAFS